MRVLLGTLLGCSLFGAVHTAAQQARPELVPDTLTLSLVAGSPDGRYVVRVADTAIGRVYLRTVADGKERLLSVDQLLKKLKDWR